jgi:homoserine O-succinyltransferase
MPVSLISPLLNGDQRSCTTSLCAHPSPACLDRLSRTFTIGLINNMPDTALEATERQFVSLLESVSQDFTINLRLYALSGIPRNELAARRIKDLYFSCDQLKTTQLDALIVTGREPLKPNLRDEPYWDSFTTVLEWAREHTISTIWSCLAAHAAILHMDEISRKKGDRKQCGIFSCTRVEDHSLLAGAPADFRLPHSRWNGVSKEQLSNSGYQVLTVSDHAGVDTFVKQDKSLFVFFQGHPEYGANTLLLEYRRDVSRYLRGETEVYPLLPVNYFPADVVAALTALQQKAEQGHAEAMMVAVDEVLDTVQLSSPWNATATAIYKNWLNYLHQTKKQSLGKGARTERSRQMVLGTDAPQTDLTAYGDELSAELSCSTPKEHAVSELSTTMFVS